MVGAVAGGVAQASACIQYKTSREGVAGSGLSSRLAVWQLGSSTIRHVRSSRCQLKLELKLKLQLRQEHI